MRKLITILLLTSILLLTAIAGGCSFRDFFSYEENTSLYVIDRPDGYSSMRFGAKLAATGTPDNDFLAVSAGQGHGTILYKLSDDGHLVDIDDMWDGYLDDDGNSSEADELATATDLVGLPFFGDDAKGCVAIGEPGGNQVSVLLQGGEEVARINLPEISGFGMHLAAVNPIAGDPWLLAVAGEQAVVVFSSYSDLQNNMSEIFSAMGEDDSVKGPISALAAGRDLERVVVAAAAPLEQGGPLGVFLFVQPEPYATTFVQVGCVERSDEPGFGGVLVLGDLNSDGVDELLVSASGEPDREQVVHVYDLAALIPTDVDPDGEIPACVSPTPLVVLVPEDGDINVECGGDCDFGLTLAVGDIATDDDGPEIMVGAPGAKVEGKGEAGAVYVYRGAEAYLGDAPLAGQVADSNPQGGHRFAGGLTVAPMAGRNEIVVGATGAGEAIIAFCSNVGTDLTAGADTTTDADGSLISTRCRP